MHFQVEVLVSTLSDKDKSFYEKNCYFIVRNLIPLNDIESYHQNFIKISNNEVELLYFIIKDLLSNVSYNTLNMHKDGQLHINILLSRR